MNTKCKHCENIHDHDEHDHNLMSEAIKLSHLGMEEGRGGPFGAVVVKDGKIIGRGQNRVTSTNDPTAHAEIVAIRDACHNIEDFSLKGATIYINCEPCPMCLAAIYWARVDRIYFAATRKDAAEIGFIDDFIYEELRHSISKRSIKMQQMLRDEALEIFQKWQEKKDKVDY